MRELSFENLKNIQFQYFETEENLFERLNNITNNLLLLCWQQDSRGSVTMMTFKSLLVVLLDYRFGGVFVGGWYY